jgi:hypothetical protein
MMRTPMRVWMSADAENQVNQPKRRAPVILRLVMYVGAGALIAALLLGRPDADADEDGSSLREVLSETSDHGDLVLKFDDDGVLRSWDVKLDGTCYGGGVDGVRWHPADNGAPARVVRRGDVIEAVEVRHNRDPVAGRITIRVALRARVTADRVTGSFRYWKRRAGGPRSERACSSLPIDFSVPHR